MKSQAKTFDEEMVLYDQLDTSYGKSKKLRGKNLLLICCIWLSYKSIDTSLDFSGHLNTLNEEFDKNEDFINKILWLELRILEFYINYISLMVQDQLLKNKTNDGHCRDIFIIDRIS